MLDVVKDLLILMISSSLISNVVLSQFLGLCPFLGVSKKVDTAVGFLIAIVILAGIREKIEYNYIPESFQGMPIVLITAGLMAIAFCGFSGLL